MSRPDIQIGESSAHQPIDLFEVLKLNELTNESLVDR